MLRYVLLFLLVLLGLVLALVLLPCLSALPVRMEREYDMDSPFYRRLYNSGVALCVLCMGVRVHATGLEKLPEGAFYLVGNHRSGFDPLLTIHALRRHPLAFVTKPEIFRLPVIRRVMWRCLCLPIDRQSPRKALPTIQRCIRLLQQGSVSMGIYPEGTRSRDGALLPFHNSVFKVAQRAGVPMAVVCVHGSENITKNAPWRPTHVSLDVVEVLPPEALSSMSTGDMAEHVRQRLEEQLCLREERKENTP